MPRTIASRRQQSSAGHFVGRFAEQRMFRDTLRSLAAQRDRRDEPATDDEPGYAQIFLVAAEGGMGKTTLLRRFEEIIRENAERAGARALYLDCEKHAPLADPDKLMRVLHDALCAAGFERELQPYRDAALRRDEVRRKAADAEEQYKSLANLGGRAVQLASGGLVDDELAAEGIHAGARAITELRAFIARKLDRDEWKLYDDPYALTETFMVALNQIATPRRPLALLLDTYELAGACDSWLRKRALQLSNEWLIWVIAGRAGQPFIRHYEDDFDASALGRILLDSFARPDILAYVQRCGIAAPTDELIDRLQALSRGIPLALEGWFNLHQHNVTLPPPDPVAPTTRREIVQRMTDRFLRYCNEDDQHLNAAARRTRAATRSSIYTLMLLRRTDLAALAAAWDCDSAQAEARLNDLADQFSFVFAQEIEREPHALVKEFLRAHLRDQRLLPVAIQQASARLAAHFAGRMRERETQLAPNTAASAAVALSDAERVALANERAAHQQTLQQLQVQIAGHTTMAAPVALLNQRDDAERAISVIDARLASPASAEAAAPGPRKPLWDDDAWRAALLDRVNALCWHDPSGEQVIKLLIPLFVEALAFNPGTAALLLTAAEEFAELWPQERRRLFDILAAGRVEGSNWKPTKETMLAIVDALQPAAERWPLTQLQRAILHIQYSFSLLKPHDKTTAEERAAALAAADEAARLLPDGGGELAETLAKLYRDVGSAYLWLKGDQPAASPAAARALAAATRLAPANQYAWYELGVAYAQLKQYAEAIRAFQQASALDSSYAAPHNGLGNVYYELKQYAEAIRAYQQAIALDPADALPHNGLGNVYRDRKQYAEAIRAYQQASALGPTLAAPHNGLGNVYYDRKQYAEAIRAYQQAIALDPTYASPHHGLGNAYYNRKQYAEAIRAYQQAIALDPTYAYPHHGMGNAYYDRKQYAEAIRAYQQAIARDPTFAAPHSSLGIVYSLLNRMIEARDEYQKALELDPHDYISMVALARIERQAGNQEQAATWIEQARARLPADEPYDRACLESIAGDADAAIAALRIALEHGSSVEWARDDPDFVFIRDDPRYRALVGLGNDREIGDKGTRR
jgi:tetratricopeptide (TPR) repeat protein